MRAQESDDLLAGVPSFAGAGGVAVGVVHRRTRVMAEHDDVGVPVPGERPFQPAQLGRAEGAVEVSARVGGVEADAEDSVGDAERVVLGARVGVLGGVAVAHRAGARVRRVQVGGQVLGGGEGARLSSGVTERMARVWAARKSP
ncbi:hypothetical protein SHKM778_79490 [Streptomyces sp. KM77-8]|uniref:Uncharacterized protein n=1 Tax=Streptomyces haneummycinicus TaxID=3074435 RepID=A0AAT9HVZ8_9ACTN